MTRALFARVRGAGGAVTHGPVEGLALARWLDLREEEGAAIDLVDATGQAVPFRRPRVVAPAEVEP